MKFVKQNTLSMISIALFAFLTIVVESSFVYDCGTELGRAAEYENAFAAHDYADNPLYLSRESTAEAVLLTRRSGQQVSLRTSRCKSLQGYSGRSSVTARQPTAFATKIAQSTICSQCGFPLPLVYRKSKEYYVYTLERMLC